MEFLEGGSLTRTIKDHHISIGEDFCRYVLYKVAKALEHMHRHGVLHRDINPNNVLFNFSGEVKLADFGIAMFLSEEQEYRKS